MSSTETGFKTARRETDPLAETRDSGFVADPRGTPPSPATLCLARIMRVERGHAVLDTVNHGQPTRSMAPVAPADAGRTVVVGFEGGDSRKPFILGFLQAPKAVTPNEEATPRRLELRADDEIVFSCGKASITLTRAGKVLIRGSYLLSRSTGSHRIQGGSVEIN